MSDNIKLVIEIPKGALKVLNETGVDWLGAEHILSEVADGKPLSDVLNEIKGEMEDHVKLDIHDGLTDGLKDAIKIINKHIGDKE